MPYFQRIQIMGVTGEAADVRFTEGGQPRAHFSIFVTEAWRDKGTGERKKMTTIFRCTAFNKVGENAGRLLKRGTWLFAEGRMRSKKVADKEFWNVTVDYFNVLERRDAEDEDQPGGNDG